ncbi:hypothetical protein ASA1KI_25010 [Opitutales bacterium ASA1]|uniref:DUF4412 domain-containing protein n=1 Tax=Congregicoccus parvus TaxID=3081749 RepID=UPI002B2F8EBA|nr:hypothetical protein ASA1KI_25010 [Opitutales bacterium ASA1]
MKTFLTTLLALLVVSSGFAKTFEGVVRFNVTSGKRSQEMEYAIKGERMRMTMQAEKGQQFGGIFDGKTGEIIVLMPEQKMYMVFGGVKEMVAEHTTADVTVEKTGRSETIAGHRCDEYLVKDKDSTIEMWAASGLGSFVPFADVQKNRGKTPGWAQSMIEKNLFPLRTIQKDRRGRVVAQTEAISVDQRTLEAALFEVPAGYQRFQLPNLGNLLKGIGG